MLDKLKLHPYLFALYPVIHLYCWNVAKVSFGVILFPSLVLLMMTYAILRLAKAKHMDGRKAAIGVTLFIIWCFSYSVARSIMIFDLLGLTLYRHRTFIVIWTILLLVLVLGFRKLRINYSGATRYLNTFALLVLMLPLLNLRNHQPGKQVRNDAAIDSLEKNTIFRAIPGMMLPNIYYIILDAYTGKDGLENYLYFDNSEFIGYLRSKGFYVAEKSHSNYAWTFLSLASSLNMDYLPGTRRSDTLRTTLFDGGPIWDVERIKNNRLFPLLQSKGYRIVDLAIWSHPYLHSPNLFSYENITNDFNLALLDMTILSRPLVENFLVGKGKREMINSKFDELRGIPDHYDSTFVYAHFLIPHHPYVFDEKGDMPGIVATLGSEKDIYLQQLQYANKQIMKTIETILARSKTPPIIIIQGDHGAYRLAESEVDNKKLRMSILNAYYVPSSCREMLYETITPVNTFRVLLNACFGEKFTLLPDRNYFSGFEDSRSVEEVTHLLEK